MNSTSAISPTRNASDQSDQALRTVLLERARALSPLVERSAEIVERDATVTQEVFAAFKEAELFWMCVPKEAGG